MHKVRVGSEGNSIMLKVVKKDVHLDKDQNRFPMNFNEEIPEFNSELEEEKKTGE